MPIIIYGAGYCGTLVCELMMNKGISPVCFFDRNEEKSNKKFMEVPIRAPITLEHPEKFLVVVCILKKGKLFEQIKDNLRQMGYSHIVHIYEVVKDKELFEKQKLILSPNTELVHRNERNLAKVYDFLEDELSKETYIKIIEFLYGDYDVTIPSLPLQEQYFAYDIYTKIDDEFFVDCGAFKGEVMDEFIERTQSQFREYWAIEPDLFYINVLHRKKNCYLDERISIIHTALGERNEFLQLRNYMEENSVVTDDGEQQISCTSLNKLLQGKGPTLIKIDVEGYEEQVLTGSMEVITRCRPVLAVAIYHKEEDFWKIPLLIREKYPFYSLFIRSYMNIHETILYAVPENRLVGG